MRRTSRKRLDVVTLKIDELPIKPKVELAAFDRFRETGELPDHQRLAGAVIERALRGGKDRGAMISIDFQATLDRLRKSLDKQKNNEPEPEPLREYLFSEAVHGPSFVQVAARQVLKILVAIGRDVTDPDFLGVTEMPDWGSVGLHVLGFPDCLAIAPYEDQAYRLFDRFDDLRGRIDRDDREWMDEYGEAAFRFLHEGCLPDDELMREVVLAYGEMHQLLRHRCGEGDSDVMVAFGKVAKARGKARAAAIAKVRAMAADGLLLSRASSK